MKRFTLAAAAAGALLAAAGASAMTGTSGVAPASAAGVPPIVWGAADDASKFASDGGSWFYGQLQGAGLTTNRWTLAWDPKNPTVIKEQAFLERAAPKAQAAGVHILLALYAGNPSPTASEHDVEGFCTWAGKVASLVKSWGIHDLIVWNEPNTRLYWMPQKDSAGNDVAAPAYESLLARCYDTIHANDENANVIGMGLSPRASTPESTEPLTFLRDVGKAYRASGRTTPIMDQLSIHPYPNPNNPTDSPDVGYQVLDRFGIPNMDRVKQAVWDAFNGTAQPTTVSPGVRRGAAVGQPLTFVIDEVGWQTDTTKYPQYVNTENVKTISEAQQTEYIQKMVRKYFACDPTIVSVQLFLLMDEPYRNGRNEAGQYVGGGWQSGLITAGGEGVSQPKEAYSQVAADFAAGRSACQGPLIEWKPKGSGGESGGPAESAISGAPDGVIDPAQRAAFESALLDLAARQAALPPLAGPTIQQVVRNGQLALNRLLTAGGRPGVPLTGTLTILVCPVRCSASAALGTLGSTARRTAAAAAYRVVARGTLASAGRTPLKAILRTTLKPGVKAPAGTYYLAVLLQSRADATKRYGFGVQLRSVKLKPVAKPKQKAKPRQKKK